MVKSELCQASPLMTLATELIISILDLLDIPTLLRCKRVCKSLSSVINMSIALEYKIELYAANLIDGPPSAQVKFARLQTLRAHQRAWNSISWSIADEIHLTEDEVSPELSAWELVGGILGVAAGHRLRFIQLPSAIRDIQKVEWVIPDIGFPMKDFAMDRSQDLLVVIELPDPTISPEKLQFHLRRLSDGQPHHLAREETVSNLAATVDNLEAWHVIQIYGDYVAIMLQALDSPIQGIVTELTFWHWKTGEKRAIIQGPVQAFTFLTEELVMLGMCRLDGSESTPERLSLEVVNINHKNTLNMATGCQSICSFLFPPLSSGVEDPELSIRTDYSSSYAQTAQYHRPFTTSDTNRLLIITCKAFHPDKSFALCIPLPTVLKILSCTPVHDIPWGDWGPAYTRMLEIELSDVWFCYVHGMKVVVPSSTPSVVELMDFCQCGLQYSLHTSSRNTGYISQTYLIDPIEVDKTKEMFKTVVTTSLPCRVQSFTTPDPLGGREFMLSEDSLVLMRDELKFTILSF